LDLKIWDWRYKIGISKNVYNVVNEYVDILGFEDKIKYKYLMSFFSDIVSLDVILDLISSNDFKTVDKSDFYSIYELKLKILHIPDLLKNYYIKKCDDVINEKPNFKDFIEELYNTACNKSPAEINLKKFYKKLYENDFERVMKIINDIKKPNYKKTTKSIDPENIYEFLNKILTDVTNNKDTIERFGKFDYEIDDFEIQIKEGIGFAEWWNKELINGERDILILYKNVDSLNVDDFIHTIYHEVYPGHGHFYNLLRKKGFKNFDYGDFELIEGWATYAEWKAVDSNYAKLLQYRGSEFLKNSFSDCDFMDRTVCLYENKIKNGYSINEVVNSVLYFNQYPGFLEGYYLGGFLNI
jgi:hypothetical protein